MRNGGMLAPRNAATAPGMPRTRCPQKMARLRMFGPGSTCASSSPSMKASLSIQPWETTCWRMLAFWPPPNAVDEIAANVSATCRSEGRCETSGAAALADIGHRPVDNRRRVLPRQNVDVHVLGVLIRRQNAHADHEALFVEAHFERDLLDAGDETVPDACVAQAKVEQRRHPLLRNDHDVHFPPLLFGPIDVVTERKNVVVFVHHLVGFV